MSLFNLLRSQNGRRRLFAVILPLALLLAACGSSPTAPDPEDILFSDKFLPGETGAWVLEADDAAGATVSGDRMMLEVNASQLIHYTTLSQPSFGDFSLEVETVQVAGDRESSYGVMFRMMGPDQFYRFDITSDGMYVVERRNPGGSWTRLSGDWADSDAIVQGLQAVNRLKVVAKGTDFSFHINGEQVFQITEGSYPAGQIALDAGTFGRPGLQVVFDNVMVSRP